MSVENSQQIFFDTNILAYMQDSRDISKQQKARQIFVECVESNSIVISTQVLQEYYNVMVNKLKQDKELTKKIIHSFKSNLLVVQVTTELIENAIEINIKTGFSFWDSLIISTAQAAGCNVIYSEDLSDGQIINGIKIVNPFANE